MNLNLTPTYNLVRKALEEHRYSLALSHLSAMAMAVKAPWDISRRIDTLRESYGYLSRYALDGAEDPERKRVIDEISSDIRCVASSIIRLSLVDDSPRQYFSVLRYEALQSDSSISGLLDRYCELTSKMGLAMLGNPFRNASATGILREDTERLADRIFNLVWASYPLSMDDESSLRAALSDETLPSWFKELLLSAVFLGALEYYDERRFVLMGELYLGSYPAMEVKALGALMLSMWMHRKSLSGRRFRSVFESMAEKSSWKADLKMVFMELVRTRDTERISRTLNDEVLPQMMKMRPDIEKTISKAESPEELMADENPEWAEMFEKSGLADKLKELNDIQADGGDVMMSTFAHLKSFPFFSSVSNWFLPFYLDNTSVSSLLGDSAGDIGELINLSPMMCDSDKYSILLSLERIPSSQRRMMLQQFKVNGVNLAELHNSELNPELRSRRNILNKYVQDLYRFFRLYRRCGEFPKPFASPVNLAAIPMLEPYFDDNDALTVVAEFYFKRGYYNEALELFDTLITRGAPTAQMYQKAGYCLQQTGRIEEAVDMYSKSEFLRPDSLWTLRRMAQCYRQLGDVRRALDYYLRVAAAKPDDMGVALSTGHCYLELGDYAGALKQYFKVEFHTPDSSKALRPIAWCLFLTGDYNRSLDYYQRLLQTPDVSMTDCLNVGHLYMAMARYKDALEYYRLAADKSDVQEVWSKIQTDRAHLLHAGVDTDMIDIVADAIERTSQEPSA